MAAKLTILEESRKVRVELPCGHSTWIGNPTATTRRHCDRTFLILLNGDESIVREVAAQ